MSARGRAAGIAAGMALAAGCAGGDDGAPDGGFVRLERRNAGAIEALSARAELPDAPVWQPRSDRCEVPEPLPGDAEYLDAGETITLVGSGATVVLARAMLGNLVVYGADGLSAGLAPAGRRFDVVLAGSDAIAARTWKGAIGMPAAIVPDGGATLELGFLVEQPLTWTPAGADEVLIEVRGAGAEPALVCRTKDDGALTLSAEQNASLPGSGTITWRAVRRTTRTLEGRRVHLEGHAATVVPYL